MSAADREPWWSSGVEEDDDPLVGVSGSGDPVDAHREARRGACDEGAHDQGPRGEHPTGHGPDVCGVCPICIGLRAIGEVRPELVSHLTEAARHLAAAARAMLEERPADRRGDGPQDDDPRHERVARIDLD